MDFPIPNETATEQSKRLKNVARKTLVANLEETLDRVKARQRELPVSFVVQCLPLSTNKMSGARKTFETKEYLEYRELIARKAGGTYGISKADKFRLYVEVGYSNKRADADNCLKPLLDSITACVDADFDDSQIYEISVKKTIIKKGNEFIRVYMEPRDVRWETVEEFPEYRVNPYGEVMNITTGRMLTATKGPDGYCRIGFYANKTSYKRLVHRVVAQAFIPNPHGYPVVNHKDEVRHHNMVNNLEWCTQQYNTEYSSTTEYHLINPEGKEVITTNLSKLCREEGLIQQSIDHMYRGRQKTHKGWRVKGTKVKIK